MAITQREVPIEHASIVARPFCVNATSADSQGNEILLAAQTTREGLSQRIRIRGFIISCNVAASVVLNEDTTALLGPYWFGAAAAGTTVVKMEFPCPVSLAAGKALRMDASAAGNVTATVWGDIVGGVASVFTSTTTTSSSTSTTSTTSTSSTTSTTSTTSSTTSTTSSSTTTSP